MRAPRNCSFLATVPYHPSLHFDQARYFHYSNIGYKTQNKGQKKNLWDMEKLQQKKIKERGGGRDRKGSKNRTNEAFEAELRHDTHMILRLAPWLLCMERNVCNNRSNIVSQSFIQSCYVTDLDIG